MDGDSGEPIEGVTFELHKQVTVDGVTTIDLNPMTGYGSLITDQDGVVPLVDNTLPAGTYELRETSTLGGYELLDGYIRFTISVTGVITLDAHPDGVVLTDDLNESGAAEYIITVPNTRRKKVSIWKTTPTGKAIDTGATFVLYRAEDYDDDYERPNDGVTPISLPYGDTTDGEGILYLGELNVGEYRLVETKAPDGYILPEHAIKISVESTEVKAWQNDMPSNVYLPGDPDWVEGQAEGTIQIRVSNNPGIEIPSTGGKGTLPYLLFGGALMTVSALAMRFRRRKTGSQQS